MIAGTSAPDRHAQAGTAGRLTIHGHYPSRTRRQGAGSAQDRPRSICRPRDQGGDQRQQHLEPHDDVASGRYQQAEFAADLWQVHLGEGTPEYRDPVEFYRRTYLTESLKDMLT